MYVIHVDGYMTLRQAIRMAESSRELHLRIFRMIGYVLSAELEKICSLLLKNKKCSGAPSHVSSGRGAFYLIFPLVQHLERVYNKRRTFKYGKEDFLRWKNSNTYFI